MSVYKLQPFQLSEEGKLSTLVEHKTSYNLDNCMLNVYETHEKALDFKLAFEGITITSMLRGRKVMHVPEHDDFDYLPGETVIVPSGVEVSIDFPDAQFASPTQCSALVLEDGYFQKQLDYINGQLLTSGEKKEIKVDLKNIQIKNSEELMNTSNKLCKILSSDDVLKDAKADVIMKELILGIIRTQNLNALEFNGRYEGTAFKAILNYIRKNISNNIDISELCRLACMSKSGFYRAFTSEFGISPNQLIIRERLRIGKTMMSQGDVSVKDVCYSLGFSDPNYFIRLFKKHEGLTPGQYLKQQESMEYA
ncbi:AraC family transcriptional regulator [bacterium]|nr:MAG: AraC family transcriptional regulator [bacterium]